MVASDNPGPLEQKLADWSGRAGSLPAEGEGGSGVSQNGQDESDRRVVVSSSAGSTP